MKPRFFRDRREAGRVLAEKLAAYAHRPDVIVLALPRGGVPVAAEVARALGAPLDVFVVRKLGVPGAEELAMGAVASGGVRVVNDAAVTGLGIPRYVVDAVTAQEQQELARRERDYRGGRPPPDVRGKTVILVDDGLATGASSSPCRPPRPTPARSCARKSTKSSAPSHRPESERASHYFRAQLRDQFDAVLHFDETRAVEPLETSAEWLAGEVPETYPFAV